MVSFFKGGGGAEVVSPANARLTMHFAKERVCVAHVYTSSVHIRRGKGARPMV